MLQTMEGSSIGFNDTGALLPPNILSQWNPTRIRSYSLSSDYTFAAVPLDEIMTLAVLSLEEIVDKIKNNQIEVFLKIC